MVRLSDEASAAAEAPDTGKSDNLRIGGPAPAVAAKSSARDLRERLGKNLAVTTTKPDHDPVTGQPALQVFSTLGLEESIEDRFDFREEIYSGGAKGRVVIATRKRDNTEVVVKIRSKLSNRGGERAWKAIMAQVHNLGGKNEHVLDIMEIVESETAFYVVMPKMNGGELFEFLATETEVPEAECKRIIREILWAVGHLHNTGLIHRDIKPENIMFNIEDVPEKGGPSPKTVKLIDFDTCLEWTPCSPKTRRFVGTPGYIAPEALLGQTTPQSDIWSIGVILYILMTGEMPWSTLVSLEDGIVGSPQAKEMYESLKKEVLEWEQEPWPEFPMARDLCQKLLAFELQARVLSVEDALAHPWLQEKS